jgi:hypothetical protein
MHQLAVCRVYQYRPTTSQFVATFLEGGILSV